MRLPVFLRRLLMKREVKYDILRILACFAVVQLHVAESYWGVVDVQSSEFAIMTVFDGLTRFAVPVFFMLSGMFLLDPERELPARKWGRHLGKLVVGFYLWSLFYAFQSVLFHGVTQGFGTVTADMWENAWTRLMMGHGHMWFMLDLFGFYLLVPILRKMCEDLRVTGYFLALWVLVRFVLQIVISVFDMQRTLALLTNMHLYALMGYIGYFIAGFYLRKVQIPQKLRYLIYASGVGAMLFTIIKTISYCRESGEHDPNYYSPGTLNVLIYSAAVFILFVHWKLPEKAADKKWITTLAMGTFFVYMIHPFFIDKLQLIGIIVINYPVAISIPVMTIAIFSVGMFLAWVVGKIPFIGKWITFR